MARILSDHARHYTDEERAEAVGLALTVGDKQAAELTGIPTRNIARWRYRPELADVLAMSRRQISITLDQAIRYGVTRVMADLADPRVSVVSKAKALRILASYKETLALGDMFDELVRQLPDSA